MPDTPQMFTRSFIVEELRKRIFGLMFLVAVSLAIWLLTPISDKVSGIWHSPEKLESIDANQKAGFAEQAARIPTAQDDYPGHADGTTFGGTTNDWASTFWAAHSATILALPQAVS